jgi:hypothetical protein
MQCNFSITGAFTEFEFSPMFSGQLGLSKAERLVEKSPFLTE